MQPEFYLILIIFIACFVQGLAGFGSTLVALPMLLTLYPLSTAVPTMVLVGFSIQILLMRRYWHDIDISAVWRLGLASMCAIPIGILTLSHVPRTISLPILGGIIILYVLYSITKFKFPQLENPRWAYLFGFTGGLLAGAYNTAGPPIILYANARRWKPRTFKGNIQSYFFMNGIMSITSHMLVGNFTSAVTRNYLFVIPSICIGLFFGIQMDRYIDAALFRKVVLFILFIMGIRLALSGL